MALETVVFPSELCGGFGGKWGYDLVAAGEAGMAVPSPECDGNWIVSEEVVFPGSATAEDRRPKRRRTKNLKNREAAENQRMTHIAVERNRRKQMNQYFAILRSLMPPSYVQRGDQASIIGGAINFVRELEQLLQFLQIQKSSGAASPFAKFFTFPQYSAYVAPPSSATPCGGTNKAAPPVAAADIEVTMVESHANLKILSRRRPRHLLNTVAGLQSLRLTILHLNVTSHDQMVLYSISLKVEEECELSTVDEIAAAVNEMLTRVEG